MGRKNSEKRPPHGAGFIYAIPLAVMCWAIVALVVFTIRHFT